VEVVEVQEMLQQIKEEQVELVEAVLENLMLQEMELQEQLTQVAAEVEPEVKILVEQAELVDQE
tara:strand:+ start:542 stop:733 length:192 start_codon:yes stop_codon:yes gene_type:complete